MRRCLRGCCLPACTQGTTCVFSKKVEYLHNLVYQALETIFNKRSQAKAAAAGGGSGANKVCVCVALVLWLAVFLPQLTARQQRSRTGRLGCG